MQKLVCPTCALLGWVIFIVYVVIVVVLKDHVSDRSFVWAVEAEPGISPVPH
jgi:hypothetical protein